MSNKKVIIYYAGFSRFGGVMSHVRAIERELTKMEWNVSVITLNNLPIWCRYIPHVVEKIMNFVNRPLGYFYKDRITGVLYKLLFDTKVNIRIFEDIYIGWNSITPSISILHAVWSDNLQSYPVSTKQQKKLRSREAKAIDRINHTVATVSAPYLKYLMEKHFSGGVSKKIDVIELGIDQSQFLKSSSGNKKSIIYVGTLEARKNILFLLEVFKKLSKIDPEYKLTLVGDGPERKKLADFVGDNGLTVDFLGALSHEKVVAELHRHGIYLHTSVKESFSYALLEAKLAGLRTCAYEKLQVPEEFIDVPISTFNIDEWCDGIVNIDWTPDVFGAEKYTVEKMTLLTLELAI
jgi:glycosyltransferase involved in cell wall biosynthesis